MSEASVDSASLLGHDKSKFSAVSSPVPECGQVKDDIQPIKAS